MRLGNIGLLQKSAIVTCLYLNGRSTLRDLAEFSLVLLDRKTQEQKLKDFIYYQDTISTRLSEMITEGMVERVDRGVYTLRSRT
jgi:hypothetical protein